MSGSAQVTWAAVETAIDWRQMVLLYDLLLRMSPSPVVRLNRAVAVRQVEGPEIALAKVNALAQDLEHYHLFHAIRGSCCWNSASGSRHGRPPYGPWNSPATAPSSPCSRAGCWNGEE